MIMNFKSCRGANCDNDHYIVKCILWARLSKTKTCEKEQENRYDLRKLKDHKIAKKYDYKVEEKLRVSEVENQTINQKIDNIKSA